MRTSRFAIPLSVALVCAGLAMYLSAKPAKDTGYEIDFNQPPTHPITEAMAKEASKMARKSAPAFHVLDVKGVSHSLSGIRDRPQLLLFILDTCPCSIDAQPIFNRFAKHWDGKIDFLGVINVDAKKGRSWASDYRPVFPVVPDPNLRIIHAYQARQSVYSALVSRKGEIVKLWPGYSADLMQEMNELMAVEIGEKPRPFDAQYAPKDKTSGCVFGG